MLFAVLTGLADASAEFSLALRRIVFLLSLLSSAHHDESSHFQS